MGNREPGAAWSGFIEGTDGWLAVVADGSGEGHSTELGIGREAFDSGSTQSSVICGLA